METLGKFEDAAATPEYNDELLFDKWRETGDERYYDALYRGFLGFVKHKTYEFCRRHPWLSSDEVLAERCLPALSKALRDHDPDRNGKLVNFVGIVIDYNLTDFLRRRGKDRGQQELDTSITKIPTDDASPEELNIANDTRRKVARLLKAVSLTQFDPWKRVIAEQILCGIPLSPRNLSKKWGIPVTMIDGRIRRVKNTIEAILSSDVLDNGNILTPQQYFLRYFFPGIACKTREDEQEQFKKLAAAGIIFTDDGKIDLTKAASNRFNTTIFKMEDGGFKVGVDFLKRRKVESVFEFFTKRGDRKLFIMPRRIPNLLKPQWNFVGGKPKWRPIESFTPEEIASALRSYQNFARINELFDIELDKEGRWCIAAQTRAFNKQWGLFCGRMRFGPKLLKLCKFHEKGQAGIEKLFKLIFGEDIDFENGKCGGHPLEKRYPEEKILAYLKTRQNLRLLRDRGIILEDGVCFISTSVTALREDCVSLYIEGKQVRIVTIMQALSLPCTQIGLMKLCQRLFPNRRIEFLRYDNGVSMRRKVA